MSTLTTAQHKQLLGAILGYLTDLQARAPAGAVADTLELNNAIRSLGAASGLSSPSDLNAFSIQPHTLASIFSGASIPAPTTTGAATSGDFEAKFAKYLSVLKDRGYFSGTAEGTPAYQALVDKARAKLLERTEGAGAKPSGAESGATATPAAPVVEVSDEVRAKAEDLKTQGNAKMTAKDFGGAIALYTEAIALVPNNAVYFANRAAAHSHTGDHQAAVDDSKQAIVLDPKYVKAYSRLGLAYFALGRYSEAISEGYEKGLVLEPNNQLMRDSLNAAKAKLKGGSSPAGSSDDAEQSPAGAPPANDFGSMMQNLMGAMGGGAGGAGGPPDLGSFLSNPNFMQMASQMAQSPQFQQMAQQLSSNPDLLNNIGSMFGQPGPGTPPQ